MSVTLNDQSMMLIEGVMEMKKTIEALYKEVQQLRTTNQQLTSENEALNANVPTVSPADASAN